MKRNLQKFNNFFDVETGNTNPNVDNHDLQHSAKIKDIVWNAKTTNVKLYMMHTAKPVNLPDYSFNSKLLNSRNEITIPSV